MRFCGKSFGLDHQSSTRIDSGFVFLIDPESGRLKKIAEPPQGRNPEDSGATAEACQTGGERRQAVMMLDTATENKAGILSDSMEKMGGQIGDMRAPGGQDGDERGHLFAIP